MASARSLRKAIIGVLSLSSLTGRCNAIAAGENNIACTSLAHPYPVILIHDLFSSVDSLDELASHLQSENFCTYAATYGALPASPNVGGMNPILQSLGELSNFVHSVKANTHAFQVDIVGHGLGGLHALNLPNIGSLENSIGKVIALGPPTNGTSINTLSNLVSATEFESSSNVEKLIQQHGCRSCTDLISLAARSMASNRDGPTTPPLAPSTAYFILASQSDSVISPPNSSFINTKKSGVSNIFIQDRCQSNTASHLSLPSDKDVMDQVAAYLDPSISLPSKCADGSQALVKRSRRDIAWGGPPGYPHPPPPSPSFPISFPPLPTASYFPEAVKRLEKRDAEHFSFPPLPIPTISFPPLPIPSLPPFWPPKGENEKERDGWKEKRNEEKLRELGKKGKVLRV
ncbi:MAG: hypothetical protein M1820_006913 [Bogoriella megaspora]|nr:MAG: hypothetical protein M1820_006913 [Bogoriella megaspora]